MEKKTSILSSHAMIYKRKEKLYQKRLMNKAMYIRASNSDDRSLSKFKFKKSLKENIKTAVGITINLRSFREKKYKCLIETFFVYTKHLELKLENKILNKRTDTMVKQIKKNLIKLTNKGKAKQLLKKKNISYERKLELEK